VLSGHPMLRNEAINAVKQWRYEPSKLNGVPTEVTTTMDVRFTLE
jgi:periplasmic protein TonB